MHRVLADEQATLGLGADLAAACAEHCVLFLQGDLGTGKTTLVRGFLRALGYPGHVKSPTYTLIESYLVENKNILHIDLYRLERPEELEFLGVREYFNGPSLCLIEWPERGRGWLPQPDVDIYLHYQPHGRDAELQAHTLIGQSLLASLNPTQS